MRKTITITDPMQVKAGDKAYFKDCDFGFTVLNVDNDDAIQPFKVMDPMTGFGNWPRLLRFDHATREVEEPEWPDPHDLDLHIYFGADGKRYIYNPDDKGDDLPWFVEGGFEPYARDEMEVYHRDALPLTELNLVPVKDDDDER